MAYRGVAVRSLSIVVSLFVFWLLLSGHRTPFLVTAGLLSALAVAWFAHRMDLVDHEGHPVHLAPRALLRYWPWLIGQIVRSAWAVTRIILDPLLPISPTLVRVKASQVTDIGHVTFANSITLTPGTVALEVDAGEILVHALTRETAAELAGGEMDRRVTEFERAL